MELLSEARDQLQGSAISQVSSLVFIKGPGESIERIIRQEHFNTKRGFYYKTNSNKIRPGLQPPPLGRSP